MNEATTTFSYNGHEYHFNVLETEQAIKMEEATKRLQKAESMRKKEGSLSELISEQCNIIKSYFDGIFGEGAGIAICTERSDLRLCMDAMNAFFAFSDEQKSEMQSFGSTFSKYSNREQRRHNG